MLASERKKSSSGIHLKVMRIMIIINADNKNNAVFVVFVGGMKMRGEGAVC